MTTDSGDDTDRYGRILRHILVNGTPVGLTMIETGNANARYDSLDGYPRHRYQSQYRAADGPNNFVCSTPAPTPPPVNTGSRSCPCTGACPHSSRPSPGSRSCPHACPGAGSVQQRSVRQLRRGPGRRPCAHLRRSARLRVEVRP